MVYTKAIVTAFGAPKVLELVQSTTLPEPNDQEVRIKVLCSRVDYTDILIRRGTYINSKKEPPFTLGHDLIGVIDKLGANVKDWRLGQKVAALTIYEANAEYVCIKTAMLLSVPHGLHDEEAATMISPYMTAYQLLNRFAPIQKNQSILILDSSDSVGTALLQLGRYYQLRMYCPTETYNHNIIKQYGGIPLDPEPTQIAERIKELEPNGVDLVLNALGGEYSLSALRLLKRRGYLIGYGYQNLSAGQESKMVKDFFNIKLWNLNPFKPSAKFYILNASFNKNPREFQEDLTQLFKLLGEEHLKPYIAEVFRLEEIQKAHQMMESDHLNGKNIILKIH